MTAAIWTLIGLLATTLVGVTYFARTQVDRLVDRGDRQRDELVALMDRQRDELVARMDRQGDELAARMEANHGALVARIDRNTDHIDELRREMTTRLDVVAGRIDAHVERHAG